MTERNGGVDWKSLSEDPDFIGRHEKMMEDRAVLEGRKLIRSTERLFHAMHRNEPPEKVQRMEQIMNERALRFGMLAGGDVAQEVLMDTFVRLVKGEHELRL